MYFITTKRMLEVCFSAHPNIQYRTFCLNVMGRKRRIVPAEGKTDMKKSVISTGIALVVLTAGIQFWGYHQVKTGNLYQDQLHAAQK